MKRWIAWMLCLLMAIGLAPSALAEETERPAETEEPTAELGEAAVHEETEDVPEVPEDGMAAPTGMYLPESGHGRKSDASMKQLEEGESLTIPDTVTKMGACAFENCENLRSVKFGNGLETTGYRAFAGCKALTTIDFGTKLNTIDDAMDNCNLGIAGPLKTIVYITQREITDVTPGKGTLTVTWDESKVFAGYQVRILEGGYSSQFNKATGRITDPKTHSYTFTGLKSGKTYHLRVRSYQVFEGMTCFGCWSYIEDGTVQ